MSEHAACCEAGKEKRLVFVVFNEPERFLRIGVSDGILIDADFFNFIAPHVYHRTHVVGIGNAEIFVKSVLKRQVLMQMSQMSFSDDPRSRTLLTQYLA